MLRLKLGVVVLILWYQCKGRLHFIEMLRLGKNILSGADTYVETKVFPVGLVYISR